MTEDEVTRQYRDYGYVAGVSGLDEAKVREAVRKGLASGAGVQALDQLSLPASSSALTVWYRKP